MFAQQPFATCNVVVHRNPERHRSNLRRVVEADRFRVRLRRAELEEQDNECLWRAVEARVPFETWQQFEWYRKIQYPRRFVQRLFSKVHIEPAQEESVRDAIYSLKHDLLNAINTPAPRPEYTLVIYTR